MPVEENIKQALEDKFDFLKGSLTVRRERRIFVEVTTGHFQEVFKFAVEELCFGFLSAITGADSGDAFEVIYHLSKDGGIMLNIRVRLRRQNASIQTVTGTFASADAYERELKDLLGIEITGLAPGRRYPLPDDWPLDQHPLRKDWLGSTSQEVPDA